MNNQNCYLFRIKKIKSSFLVMGLIFLFITLQGCVAYGPQPYYSSTPVGYYSYPSATYYSPSVSFSFIPRFFGGYGRGGYSEYGHDFRRYGGGFSEHHSHGFSSYGGGEYGHGFSIYGRGSGIYEHGFWGARSGFSHADRR